MLIIKEEQLFKYSQFPYYCGIVLHYLILFKAVHVLFFMFSFTILTHFRGVGQQKPNPLKIVGNEKEGGP
jgi:hypothetical protein